MAVFVCGPNKTRHITGTTSCSSYIIFNSSLQRDFVLSATRSVRYFLSTLLSFDFPSVSPMFNVPFPMSTGTFLPDFLFTIHLSSLFFVCYPLPSSSLHFLSFPNSAKTHGWLHERQEALFWSVPTTPTPISDWNAYRLGKKRRHFNYMYGLTYVKLISHTWSCGFITLAHFDPSSPHPLPSLVLHVAFILLFRLCDGR